MAAVWGLESGFQGVEAMKVDTTTEVCLSSQASTQTTGNFWLRLTMLFMFAVMMVLSVKFFFMWKQTNKDLTSCWTQVAEEDAYVTVQEARIDELFKRCQKIEDRNEPVLAQLTDEVETAGNEISMTHDCCEGLHYAIVEHGGYSRNGSG